MQFSSMSLRTYRPVICGCPWSEERDVSTVNDAVTDVIVWNGCDYVRLHALSKAWHIDQTTMLSVRDSLRDALGRLYTIQLSL